MCFSKEKGREVETCVIWFKEKQRNGPAAWNVVWSHSVCFKLGDVTPESKIAVGPGKSGHLMWGSLAISVRPVSGDQTGSEKISMNKELTYP